MGSMGRVKLVAGFFIIISFFSAVGILMLFSSKDKRQEATTSLLIASHIYDSLAKEIYEPITISKTMAADSLLQTLLKNEESYPQDKAEAIFSDYLASLRDKMGYLSTFVISEKTHRYYTPHGIGKVVNPKTSPYDIWYTLFLDSGKQYDLDTDRDEENGYQWTVFVNFRIEDQEGKLLGVCGVGLFMNKLQELIDTYESEYQVKINLIDLEGLVQVDSNSINIENAYIAEAILDKPTANKFTYTRRGVRGYRMCRYMEPLEWHLVVQGNNMERGLTISLLAWLITFCLVLIILFMIIAHFMRQTEIQHNLAEKSSDELTGLPNRNYFQEAYGEMGVFNTTRYLSMAVFDVDNFRYVNERQDGDKTLQQLTALVKDSIQEQGMLLRWGGDEFVVLLEIPVQKAEHVFRDICKNIREQLHVTLSVGIVEINLSDKIKTNYYRAVQLCYAAKESGGNEVRKG